VRKISQVWDPKEARTVTPAPDADEDFPAAKTISEVADSALWVGLLGPLEVRLGGVSVTPPRGRQAIVLAVLALSAGKALR
jgi:hypothetical protein